jgi:hypothetical protein
MTGYTVSSSKPNNNEFIDDGDFSTSFADFNNEICYL